MLQNAGLRCASHHMIGISTFWSQVPALDPCSIALFRTPAKQAQVYVNGDPCCPFDERMCTLPRSGPLLSQTNGFPALRWLNVSSNAFTGALPAAYKSCGIFTLVSLVRSPSSNQCVLLQIPGLTSRPDSSHHKTDCVTAFASR